MGQAPKVLAVAVALFAVALGAWVVAIAALAWLGWSLRGRGARERVTRQGEVLPRSGRPWGRWCAGAVLLLLAAVAARSGGTYSPFAFGVPGIVVLLWPRTAAAPLRRVSPVAESILLRRTYVPFVWHAFAEVKLGREGRARAVSALNGTIVLFGGTAPSVLKEVSVRAVGHSRAESKAVRRLRSEAGRASARGAYLLPLDSSEAAKKLSAGLARAGLEAGDFEHAQRLPFEVLALRSEEGRVASYDAFDLLEERRQPSVLCTGSRPRRRPLLWEVAEKVEEMQGWPGPDGATAFLASLDATRAQPFELRVKMAGESPEEVAVEGPGGTQATVTRAQLRALARIYG
jgi:hypothetical protein